MGIGRTLKRAHLITHESIGLLWANKSLLVLPVFSLIANGLIVLVFATPFFFDNNLFTQMNDSATNTFGIVYGFLFYLAIYTVVNIFNVALVHAILGRLDGKPVSAAEGLRFALSRLPQIFVWSAICATVGIILNILKNKLDGLAEFLFGLVGLAWAVATFFVIPVLVAERVGPIAAIERSSTIMRKTWGSSLAADFGVAFLIVITGAICIAALIALSNVVPEPWFMFFVVAIGGVLAAAYLFLSTAAMVLRAVLYSYALTGKTPGQFDPTALQNAFVSR